MAWEDELNERTQTGYRDDTVFAAQADQPTPVQYQEGYYARVAAAGPAPTDYPGTVPIGTLNPTGRVYRCSRDQHYFDCKHEIRCQCGLTERLPLQVQEGL